MSEYVLHCLYQKLNERAQRASEISDTSPTREKIPYARPAHEVISIYFIGLYPPGCIFHIFVDIFNYSRFPRWTLNYWIFLLIVVFPLKPNCQSLNGFELPDKIMWSRVTYHHLNKSNLALISRDTNSKTRAMMTRPWWQGIEISPVKGCWFRLPQYWNHFIFVWGKVLDMKR